MAGPMDRLKALDAVEKDILACLQSAGQTLLELSKDKPSMKQSDSHATNFLKTLNHVEIELAKHINYLTQVSTGQAHEGSSYAAQKVLQMAWHRTEHARSKVMEMERMKNQAQAMHTSVGTRLPTTNVTLPTSASQPSQQVPSYPPQRSLPSTPTSGAPAGVPGFQNTPPHPPSTSS